MFSLCGHPIIFKCYSISGLGFILMASLQPYLFDKIANY